MRRAWLVSYDIACPRRWRRVFRRLKRRGEPLQLSVFVVRTDAAGAERLAAELARMTDPAADRLLVLPLDPAAAAALPGGPKVGIV